MTRSARVLIVLAAPLVTIGCVGLAWTGLPAVRQCYSIYCGPRFDSGGIDVFGRDLFTLPQTIAVGLGIAVGAYLLSRGLLPQFLRWTSVGFGVLSLTFVVGLTLPSRIVGPAPQVPCSTPGADGAIAGSCTVGPTPTDDRAPERGAIAVVGMACLAAGVLTDRRRREAEQSSLRRRRRHAASSTSLGGALGPSWTFSWTLCELEIMVP